MYTAVDRTGSWRSPMGDIGNLDDFLARPLVARVATHGPTVRPVWYIFEERAFWWLTKTGTVLANAIERGEPIALVVDCCDLQTGEVIKVSATGRAEILALDKERGEAQVRPVPRSGSEPLGSTVRSVSRRPRREIRPFDSDPHEGIGHVIQPRWAQAAGRRPFSSRRSIRSRRSWRVNFHSKGWAAVS
jgi:Pyridoxamine 5'-phosphate oxidase